MYTSASQVKATGTRPTSNLPRVRTSGRTGHSSGRRPRWDGTRSVPARPTQRAMCNPKSHRGTASATATTRSRSLTSTCADAGTVRGKPTAEFESLHSYANGKVEGGRLAQPMDERGGHAGTSALIAVMGMLVSTLGLLPAATAITAAPPGRRTVVLKSPVDRDMRRT